MASTVSDNLVTTHHYTESGLDNVYLKDWPAIKKEDDVLPLLHNPAVMERPILYTLIGQSEALNDAEIQYLRKHIGYHTRELADLLGVEQQDVCRWENGRAQIPKREEFHLRMLAFALAENTHRDELRAKMTHAREHYIITKERAPIYLQGGN